MSETASTTQEAHFAQDLQEQTTQKIWPILLRNNIVATVLTLLFGGALLTVQMMLMGDYPRESDVSLLEYIFTGFAMVFLAASIIAPIIYPILAFFLLKPLPRMNFLSVAAPVVLLAIVAFIDFFATPLELLSGGFNHIALCGFCHAFGPGAILEGFNESLAPLGGIFTPIGYSNYPSLPVLLIAAFYPSLLFYIGICLKRIYKVANIEEGAHGDGQFKAQADMWTEEKLTESPNYLDPEQQESTPSKPTSASNGREGDHS